MASNVDPIEFLLDKQSYLKCGDEKVADRLGIRLGEAREAKETAKKILRREEQYRYGGNHAADEHTETEEESTENESKSTSSTRDDDIPPTAEDAYQEHLKSLGLTEEEVDSVKYWQTMSGEHRFSIVQKYNEKEGKSRQALLDLLEDHFENYTPPTVTGAANVNPRDQGNLGIINLYDAHIDKLALATETAEASDATMQDNIRNFEESFIEFLHILEENNVTKAHFPLGHDLFNTNGDLMMTKNGTPQKVNIDWHTAFSAGLDMVRRCIDAARQILNELEVIMVPGNHAPDKTFYLGEVLRHVYRNADDVSIDHRRLKRKYRLEGDVLLGYSHGNETKSQKRVERLPLNMATEAEERWSKADFRVMFLGDIHHKKKYKILHTVDSVGCEVNFLRSVGPQNKYEFDNGFTGVPKTAQLDVFSPSGKRRWHKEKTWW
jgi:hypothetical protein